MASNTEIMIYDHQHTVSVNFESTETGNRTVAVRMLKYYNNKLVIKVQEVDNYNFNYTGHIDQSIFNKMKCEQSLEIDFNEIHSQMVDLLKETIKQTMFLRLEANHMGCKLIFYEKSRLKCLIFLTVDLQVTNQGEIIEEMAKNLELYKKQNHSLSYNLESTKCTLQEVNNQLKALSIEKLRLEAHCREQLSLVANKFTTSFNSVENTVLDKISKLGRRHVKLQNDMEVLKNENKLKCESNARLLASLQSLRLENERNSKLLDDFKLEVDHLKLVKGNTDDDLAKLRRQLLTKEGLCDDQQRHIEILKKDLQEATVIITQKSKLHDEISKDLVQANSMLVNFTTQYDNLAKDFDTLKVTFDAREKLIASLQKDLKSQEIVLLAYKGEYGPEKIQMLQNEIFLAKKMHQDLDKQYKEAIKLNALLTRKVSGNEQSHGHRTQNQTQAYINSLPPPSQRSNY